MSNNNIGAALASEMARRSLGDRETGDMLGVNQSTISRWRKGVAVPQHVHSTRLAAFLGMKASQVDKLIDDAERPSWPTPPAGTETFGQVLRQLEHERGMDAVEMWMKHGLDKARYYRLRADKATPAMADLPDLSRRLGVPVERLLTAAFHTEMLRTGQLLAPTHAPRPENAKRISVGAR